MKIEEKLNSNTWLAHRENAGWEFRVIVTSTDNLEVGRSYFSNCPVPGISRIESLCEVTGEMVFGEYDDRADYDDYKEDVLEVLRGELTVEELKEYHEIN